MLGCDCWFELIFLAPTNPLPDDPGAPELAGLPPLSCLTGWACPDFSALECMHGVSTTRVLA